MGASKRQRAPPYFWRFRSSKKFIVYTVCFAIFSDVVLYGVIIPVFPFALTKRSGVPEDQVQRWVAALLGIYGLGFSIGSPLFGWLADHFRNRWWPLIGGLSLMLVGTFMMWFAIKPEVLCFARFLQGLATADIWSVGLALIIDTVGPSQAGEYMGIVGAAMSIGFVGAPSFSGLIYDKLGYDAVFIFAVSMIVIDIILRLLLIEKKDAVHYILQDPNDPQRPLLPQEVDVGPKVDLEPHALPLITLLKSPRLVTAVYMAFVEAIIMTGMETTLPLHVREKFNYNSTAAGLCFAIVVFGDFFSPWVGKVCDRYGSKYIVLAGTMLSCVSILLTSIPQNDTKGDQVFLWILLLFLGFSHALIFVPALTELSVTVEQMEKDKPGIFGPYGAFAQGYGLSNFAYAAGTTVGPLWSGFMRHSVGWTWMVFAISLFSLLSGIPVLLFMGKKSSQQNSDSESLAEDA